MGAGAGVGAGAGTSLAVSLRPSRGAMIAFSTLVELQTGQAISERLACLSQAAELANQLSNVWPLSQLSV